MKRAERNRTITLTTEEYQIYSNRLFVNADLLKNSIINKTINANLFDIIDFLPSEFADLIIIDPPYNLSKNYNGFKFKSTSNDNYLDYLRSWFHKIVRCLRSDGSLYICGDWKSTAALQQIMTENLHILNRITWQREKGRGAKNNWKNCMEDIWFGVKDKNNYYFDVDAVKSKRKVIAPYKKNGEPKDWQETSDGNFRMSHPSNFWDDISVPFWSMPENTDHPTQKPEKLIAKLILASCPKGGVVFDPFLGSGTTSVTAKKLGRNYIGIEMDTEYCCIAEKRLQLADQCTTIQGYSDGVFWERNTLNSQIKESKKQTAKFER